VRPLPTWKRETPKVAMGEDVCEHDGRHGRSGNS
jgi:hypothetical protein